MWEKNNRCEVNTMVNVKSLDKIYETGEVRVHALNQINLTIRQGEFLAIMGASGSGKSTLLHIIGGIDRATNGEVVINQQSLTDMNENELTLINRMHIGGHHRHPLSPAPGHGIFPGQNNAKHRPDLSLSLPFVIFKFIFLHNI